ncbi:PASTA domain, binds beta-lactams [Eubacterium ruminantium]|nr:PASTA domain, binds beta-lactams [Eubacterium ruminantium]
MAKKICLGCMEQYDDRFEVCPYCGYIEGTGPKEPYHLMPGTVLQGKYIVGKSIGYGGFGVTYIGYDYMLNHKIAIKEYLPGEFSTRSAGENTVTVFEGEKHEQFENGIDKFVEEARKLAAFRDIEGIVKVYDSFKENNTAYIVMEYLEGKTIKDILEYEGRMEVERAIMYIVPILDALTQIHSVGLLHRDISPDNIFVTNDGRVKLIDFGAARYASSTHSKSLSVIVKQGYAPQEQYRSRGDQGAWSDVYAAAATLYKMITGITPQDAMERGIKDELKTPRKLGVKIPKNKQNALLNAMNLKIEKRTQSAGEFKEQLLKGTKRIGDGKGGEILPKWPRWLKIVSGTGAVAITTLIILLATNVIKIADIIPGLRSGLKMPYVVNKTVEEAEEILKEKNLLLQVTDKIESDSIPKDYILSQNVVAGKEIKINTAVEVTVSAGGKVIYMDNYIGCDAEESKQKLDELEITYMTEEGESEIAPGCIYEQSIAPDTEVNKGSSVDLKVSTGISSYDSTKTTKVPELKEKNWEDGKKAIREKNLYIKLVSVAYSTTIPKGQIFEQDPEVGMLAKEGDIVEVKVSLGIMTVRVPDVQFKDKDEAVEMIEAVGLKAVLVEEENDTVAKNHVIRQSVEAGTEVEITTDGEPTEITIYISKGVDGVVPDVVGKKLSTAKKSIVNAGFAVGKVTYVETASEKQNGKVSKQNPSAGQKAEPGSSVNLSVYKYKGSSTEDDSSDTENGSEDEPEDDINIGNTTVPDVVGKSESSARSSISAAQLSVGSISYKETTDENKDGKVVSQNPVAGSVVKKNKKVNLVIYKYSGDEPYNPADKISVPNVVGRSESSAKSNIKSAGLVVGNISYKKTEDKDKDGVVASQNPKGGEEVDKGSAVNITVYKYTETEPVNPKVTVPDVIGKSESSARTAISNAGLKVGSVTYTETTDKSKADVVAKQKPSSGAEVDKGSSVNITVYKYTEPEPVNPKVKVPDVIGKSENSAKTAISNAGLKVGSVDYTDTTDKSKEDVVAKQNPSSGTEVDKGSAVSITVYRYKEVLVTVPNVVGISEKSARSKITNVGLVVGDLEYVPTNDEDDDGKVKSQSPAGGKEVKKGTEVSLVVYYYDGVTVPDLVGKTYDSAVQLLKSNNLEVGNVTYKHDSSSSSGKVLSQKTSAGTSVSKGSYVDITVCDNTTVKYYRYKTVTSYEMKTTTSMGSLGSDWEYYDEDTSTTYGEWDPWSQWSRTKPDPDYNTDTHEVEKRTIPATYKTQYNYSKYAQYSNGTGWSGPSVGWWSGKYCQYYVERGWSDQPLGIYDWDGSIALYGRSGDTWFNETTRQVINTNAYDEWRYRDRTKTVTTIYTYRRPVWSSWSEWSEDAVSENSTRKVETKTIYWDESP